MQPMNDATHITTSAAWIAGQFMPAGSTLRFVRKGQGDWLHVVTSFGGYADVKPFLIRSI